MADYYTPRKAVVIAGSRVGSIMLCNALDSHPAISCERTEPLNWRTSVYLREGLDAEATLRIVLGRPGFQWAMCKVSYRQIAKIISLEALKALGVKRVIHLWRENVLRVVVSAALNTAAWNAGDQTRTHAWETPPLRSITLDAREALEAGRRYLARKETMKTQIAASGLPYLPLSYEQIRPTHASWINQHVQILDFLDLLDQGLQTLDIDIQPINPYPLSEIVSNWTDVKAALAGTELERWTHEEDSQ